MLNTKLDSLFFFFKKLKFVIDKILSIFLIALMGIMTILVTYQVIIRYVFDSPSAFSEVASRYLFIWMILFGSAYVFGLREHMSITFIKDKFNQKTRIILEMFIELVTVSFAYTVMIIGGYNGALRQMMQLDSSLQIPMGFIYIAIPASGIIMLFYFVYHEIGFVKALSDLKKEPTQSRGNM